MYEDVKGQDIHATVSGVCVCMRMWERVCLCVGVWVTASPLILLFTNTALTPVVASSCRSQYTRIRATEHNPQSTILIYSLYVDQPQLFKIIVRLNVI